MLHENHQLTLIKQEYHKHNILVPVRKAHTQHILLSFHQTTTHITSRREGELLAQIWGTAVCFPWLEKQLEVPELTLQIKRQLHLVNMINVSVGLDNTG